MQILISSKVRKQKLFSSATIIIKYESFNKALFSAMKIAEALAEFEDSHADCSRKSTSTKTAANQVVAVIFSTRITQQPLPESFPQIPKVFSHSHKFSRQKNDKV